MSVYVIAQLKIKDIEKCDEYQSRFPKAFQKSGGKLLVVDSSPTILEGEWNDNQVVLMEFPDQTVLQTFLDSPEFKEVAEIRSQAVEAVTLIAKGL